MDRFRFRFWNKRTNDWTEACKGLDGLSMFGESMVIGGSLPGISIEDMDNIIVEQCTGLKDKNGTLIYEGDIIRCKMSHNGGSLPHMGKVVYHDHLASFATQNDGGVTLIHNHLLNTFEVIGNIHDNPELLA